VCLQHRLKPATAALHALLREGGLGRLTGGVVVVPWWRGQEYYDRPGRGSPGHDGGGALITQAIHTLDVLVYCAGLPERVVGAATATLAHRMAAEDVAAATLRYPGGALVGLVASTAANPGGTERVELWGTAGSAVLAGGGLTVFDPRPRVVVAESGASAASDPGALPLDWHLRLWRDTLDAFAEGREPCASGRSALDTQRLVDAIYRAAASGNGADL